jgi:hypothetical protein
MPFNATGKPISIAALAACAGVARRTGTAIGLLQWLRLQLDDVDSFENRPSDTVTPSAWRQVFYPFTRPVELREGETMTLWAAHDLVSMAFAPMEP